MAAEVMRRGRRQLYRGDAKKRYTVSFLGGVRIVAEQGAVEITLRKDERGERPGFSPPSSFRAE